MPAAGNRAPCPENSIRKENVTVSLVYFETSGIINVQVGARRRISHPPRDSSRSLARSLACPRLADDINKHLLRAGRRRRSSSQNCS